MKEVKCELCDDMIQIPLWKEKFLKDNPNFGHLWCKKCCEAIMK